MQPLLSTEMHTIMPDTHVPDAKPVEIEDIGSNPAPRETIGELTERRLSRRAAMLGLGAATFADQLLAAAEPALAQAAAADGPSSLGFKEIAHRMSQRDAVPEGYEIQVLMRWGDAVVPDAPAWSPTTQSPEAQAAQFGYNSDFIDFRPLPAGSNGSDRGLLCVNHEYLSLIHI